ncbi:MAG: hypothetical protein ACTJLM_02065 [Ehrlichia sp.]
MSKSSGCLDAVCIYNENGKTEYMLGKSKESCSAQVLGKPVDHHPDIGMSCKYGGCYYGSDNNNNIRLEDGDVGLSCKLYQNYTACCFF